jgi:serine/threonine protein kinase
VSADDYGRAKAIFQEALALEGADRGAFLGRACAGDAALRAEVESLLSAYSDAGDFLAEPAFAQSDAGRAPDIVGRRVRARICAVCHRSFDSSALECPDDRTPLVAVEDRLVGATLDGTYEVERFLGRGGMGAVYLARHRLTERPVAIKVLSEDAGADPSRVQRFIIEGKAACRFLHPNAVIVYDLRTSAEGVLYMALEYVDGESLGRMLHRGARFSPEEALRILEPVASVLDAAHASGVVHRDVKPDNIMLGRGLGEEPTVKVLDLGIAKLREVETDLTKGAAIGTPPYMSPEQWGGAALAAAKEIDGRADVYSLGVVAYEMVVGARPFAGPQREDYRRQHLTEEPPAAHAVHPAVPAPFGDAIRRALSKDRAMRQATAGELVAQLRAALGAGAPYAARPGAADALDTRAEAEAPPGRPREWIVGSDPQCAVVVPKRTVSRRHCRLVESEGGYLLEDLGSTNGTFVNGIRIVGPVAVTPRDRIMLGAHEEFPWPTDALPPGRAG